MVGRVGVCILVSKMVVCRVKQNPVSNSHRGTVEMTYYSRSKREIFIHSLENQIIEIPLNDKGMIASEVKNHEGNSYAPLAGTQKS